VFWPRREAALLSTSADTGSDNSSSSRRVSLQSHIML
jgi:hypothetical protein